MSKLNYIDLFAGAGGLSEGFNQAGFNAIAHVEIDNAACKTLTTRSAYHFLKENNQLDIYNSYLSKAITREELYSYLPIELTESIINLGISNENNNEIYKKIDFQINNRNIQEIDLIIGGPPCQAYSLVGRARSEHGMKRDPRNFLYVQYAAYLEKYKPKMFVFENVIGLLSAGSGMYLENMKKLFKKKGYSIEICRVNAENFGVLQMRKRLIIIGWKDDFIPNIPNFEKYQSNINSFVNSIFKDLPKLEAGSGKDVDIYVNNSNEYLTKSNIRVGDDFITQHIARPHTLQDKKIYEIAVDRWNNKMERLNYNHLPDKLKTHKNRTSFTDRFKVVADNLQSSQTVVAHIAKDGHYYIHPDIEQNRSISVREAARIQSFPDNYYFEGVKESINRTAAFKQIGNAVPPLMAKIIADQIKGLI
ncbi:DNA cytosine methyltransferase [Chryseobacterium sp. Y16C]|uniref:DNA cytosine methyltransferase n=1 Tax=Chryseobacterium sp. Y16C TaxID=2920939 RepID=UPI001F0A9977|nr:DNA (cytosine-5-)-methyltransferase [Chryseobacterium sp. Y16C]UMQ41160.1 DNA cytosine methyltransferase [Chryseobacterium sp. Y16C]